MTGIILNKEISIKEKMIRLSTLHFQFESVHFNDLSITNIITLCLSSKNREDAKYILKQYEQYCDTPEIAHSNLGYMFGYCNAEDRKKLYDLFLVNHPIFGSQFGRED